MMQIYPAIPQNYLLPTHRLARAAYSSRVTLLVVTLSVSMVTTLIAVNTITRYNHEPLLRFKISLLEFHQRNPMIPLIGALFCVIMALIWMPLSVLSMIPLGIYAGCRVHLEQNLKLNHSRAIPKRNKTPSNLGVVRK